MFEEDLTAFITSCKGTLETYPYCMQTNSITDSFDGAVYCIYVAFQLDSGSRFSIENNNIPIVLPFTTSVADIVTSILELIDSIEPVLTRANSIEVRFV